MYNCPHGLFQPGKGTRKDRDIYRALSKSTACLFSLHRPCLPMSLNITLPLFLLPALIGRYLMFVMSYTFTNECGLKAYKSLMAELDPPLLDWRDRAWEWGYAFVPSGFSHPPFLQVRRKLCIFSSSSLKRPPRSGNATDSAERITARVNNSVCSRFQSLRNCVGQDIKKKVPDHNPWWKYLMYTYGSEQG